MSNKVPLPTIHAFARSIYKEASKYGFGQLDVIRLVNELMDYCTAQEIETASTRKIDEESGDLADEVTSLPATGKRLAIRSFEESSDSALLRSWLSDQYGRHFVLSATAAHSLTFEALIADDSNHIGIITTLDEKPIGALAYLDYDIGQKRAELRKLIGDPEFRGLGLAEEATRMWISYGINALHLEKIYVSTLQTHISNIRLNERIGFQVEGLLRDEVLIDGIRHDVLRMGYCRK